MSTIALNASEPGVIIRVMLTSDDAIDLFLGDCVRRGYSDRTRTTYSRILDKFDARLPDDQDISKVTADDCRRFLDTFNRRTVGTRAHAYSVLSSFFKWLYVKEKIARNPMERIDRPRRLRAEDTEVVEITKKDVLAMLAAAHPGPELNALAILAYLGPRRRAAARLRLRDYNQETGELRFFEKGGKTIWKPAPDELRQVLDASIARGEISPSYPFQPDEPYLIPPEGPLVHHGARDDRVIYRIVTKVAARAGVRSHVHALRGAFAVFYLESFPGDTYGLQNSMGHASAQTTQVYLRRYDKRLSMQPLRGLSWASAKSDNVEGSESPQIAAEWLAVSESMGAGGFEPPLPESIGKTLGCGPTDASSP